MKNLLSFELHKLFRQKSLYIGMAVLAAMTALMGVVYHAIDSIGGETALGSGTLSLVGAVNGNLQMRSAFSGTVLNALIIIVVSMYASMDFARGTIKNVLSRGFTRTEGYLARYLVSLLAMLILAGVQLLLSFLMGTALGGVGTGYDGEFWCSCLLQLLCLACQTTLIYLVVTVTGKSGAAIAICIVVSMVLSLGLSLIDLIPNLPFTLSAYWIDNVQVEVANGVPSGLALVRVLLTCTAYLAGGLFLGMIAAWRKEV